MGEKRKGYNTKPRSYRKRRLEALAIKVKKRYQEYLAAFNEGKLSEYRHLKPSQHILDK